MIPRAHNRLDRRLGLHQHVGHIITITVLHSADEKGWCRDFAEWPHPLAPERTIVLMFQIEQRPRRRIEARPQHFFIERIIRRAHPALRHIHVQFKFVNMCHAVDIVNVVVKQLRGSVRRENRLQGSADAASPSALR